MSCHGAGSTGDIGSLTEVAFFHKASRTLLLTDAVILVPPEPPAVVQRRDLLSAGAELPLRMPCCNGSVPGESSEAEARQTRGMHLYCTYQVIPKVEERKGQP